MRCWLPLAAALVLAVWIAPGIGPVSCTAQAQPLSGSSPLDSYLENLKTLRATFVQTLVDAHGREIDRASGKLIVSRPGKFRWEIHPAARSDSGAGRPATRSASGEGRPAAGSDSGAGGPAPNGSGQTGSDGSGQLMVADGRNLWFFDRDLDQVTVKPVDAALSATPAMLLSGTLDLRKNFTITPAGQRDGLEWVLVEPSGAEADFRSALFGFSRGDLKRMILEDKLGQTATIVFEHVERNGPVSPAEVSFTPPAGADVIGTPQK